jgi:hypothetical protein
MNFSVSQFVIIKKMRDMILNRDSAETVTEHTERQIKCKRCEDGVRIVTEPADKIYRVSFFKCRRLPDNRSVHFGYI